MSVIENIFNVVKNVVALARDLRNYQSEIKEIRHELRDLTFIIQRLAQEIQHGKEMAVGERANILLEVENKLLHFEKCLPVMADNKNKAPRKLKRGVLKRVEPKRSDEHKESEMLSSSSVASKVKRAKG
jgi:hypothetical protein